MITGALGSDGSLKVDRLMKAGTFVPVEALQKDSICDHLIVCSRTCRGC